MEPSREPSDCPELAAASTSKKPQQRFNVFRSIRARMSDSDNSLLSCFQFLRSNNYAERLESKYTLSSNDSLEFKEPSTPPKKEIGGVQICEKCKKIFLLQDVAGEDHQSCPTCYSEREDEQNLERGETPESGACGGDTEALRDDDIFKHPIQCISCKKIHRTKLKEYLTDEDVFHYVCLDCSLRKILLTKKPDSAFDLASSIVEKEISNLKGRMWESMCEKYSCSPVNYDGCERKCDSPLCKGYSRFRVQCNFCSKNFHTRCVSLPDYNFQFFRCNECRNKRMVDNWSDTSSSSLEQRALLRKPETSAFSRFRVSVPMVCHICKSQVVYNFDHMSIRPEPSRLRCLNCMHGTELMV